MKWDQIVVVWTHLERRAWWDVRRCRPHSWTYTSRRRRPTAQRRVAPRDFRRPSRDRKRRVGGRLWTRWEWPAVWPSPRRTGRRRLLRCAPRRPATRWRAPAALYSTSTKAVAGWFGVKTPSLEIVCKYNHDEFTQLLHGNTDYIQKQPYLLQFLPLCIECRRGLGYDENSVCPSVRPSVHLSVKRVICDKTTEWCVQIFIPYEKSLSLVFWNEEWLVGATSFTWNFRLTGTRWSEIANFIYLFNTPCVYM